MLFNNATIYQFVKEAVLDETFEDVLNDAITSAVIAEVGPNDISSVGWGTATPNTDELIFKQGSRYLLRLIVLEKVIPAKAIRKAVADKVSVIQRRDARPVSRKERAELKEQVIMAALPGALVSESSIMLYIDTSTRTLVVNSASAKAADLATSFLRKGLGSLPIRPLELAVSPVAAMTSWLKDSSLLPPAFELKDTAKLKDTEGSAVTLTKFDDDSIVLQILDHSLECQELRLGLQEGQADFTLTKDMTLKGIKWAIEDESSSSDEEDILSSMLFLTTKHIHAICNDLGFQGAQNRENR